MSASLPIRAESPLTAHPADPDRSTTLDQPRLKLHKQHVALLGKLKNADN